MRKLRSKLASKGGFTLTELIVTMAIMALVGVAVAVGITTAGKAYSDLTQSSEASMLCSTIAIELSDELRFAANVKKDELGVVTFTGSSSGEGSSVLADENGHIIIQGESTKQLLSEKAYTSGLEAAVKVTYENGAFHVILEIENTGGVTLSTTEFSIKPLSP